MIKISKVLSAAAAMLLAVIMSAVTSFAADDDICLFEGEKRSNGGWGQAFSLNIRSNDKYENLMLMLNENSKIYVYLEFEGTPPAGTNGVEFILQKWETQNSQQIWARSAPTEITENTAVFDHNALVTALGTDDLSIVDHIYVCDTGAVIKVTKVVFDIRGDGVSGETADVPEVGETISIDPPTETSAEETQAETTSVSEESSAHTEISENTTASSADESATEAAEETKESSPVNIQAIVVAVIIGITLIVAVIIVIVYKSREKYY